MKNKEIQQSLRADVWVTNKNAKGMLSATEMVYWRRYLAKTRPDRVRNEAILNQMEVDYRGKIGVVRTTQTDARRNYIKQNMELATVWKGSTCKEETQENGIIKLNGGRDAINGKLCILAISLYIITICSLRASNKPLILAAL